MKNSLDEFKSQIDLIRTHLDVNKRYGHIISLNNNDDANFIKRNSTNEKIFTYRSNIISLYGAFEHFIENIIVEYIVSIQKCMRSFDDWEEPVRNKYFELWKRLHGKLSYVKFSSITEEGMVENIYDVVVNNKGNLLPECFLQNGGNYNSKIIESMFSDIGIISIRSNLIKNDAFSSYLTDTLNLNRQELINKIELCYNKLDDLVERRNDIAHGSESVQLIDDESFKEYVTYVECFSEALNSFLEDRVIGKIISKNKPKTFRIQKTWQGGSVALLILQDVMKMSFSVGDELLVKNSGGNCPKFFKTKIYSIRVDLKNGEQDKEEKTVIIDEKINAVSLGLSCKVKSNQSFFVL